MKQGKKLCFHSMKEKTPDKNTKCFTKSDKRIGAFVLNVRSKVYPQVSNLSMIQSQYLVNNRTD